MNNHRKNKGNNANHLKEVTIYTDGACSGNPGKGGFGAVLTYKNIEKNISGGFELTTNNRMELKAVIESLKALKERCKVTIYTDSQYVAEAINQGWVFRWKANNWKKNKREYAENIDLWEELLTLMKKHKVTVNWVRGHSGVSRNEKADRLAVRAMQNDNPEQDKGYQPKKQSE